MALKKSELYSSLWQGCDELRGGMDASQYKDYVLVLLFIKYVSDKYAGMPYAPITIPAGAGFADLVALKGNAEIGDLINKQIIAPLQKANSLEMPDFNDATKLGSGKEKVERLTNLIAIFENPALDFSRNRADGDDILGDAYEYLMRHFATESGKSKGQFYTPAEVSRIMAQIIGISSDATATDTTVYDPACGSGSLLLKVGDAAPTPVTLYGQEKDAATAGLARMNMILHDNASALIHQGNTLADPKFSENGALKTFDYVVANPPFSDKRWSNGIDPDTDLHERFKTFGAPPAKQGDYAYLLHILRSLKSTGKAACILPHGVLFRGHAEAGIRRKLVERGLLQGIIGLPANLFYGTGIAACILVISKRDAKPKAPIFIMDASAGFLKDGPKNRLRDMDIHRIVDTFTKRIEDPHYARLVPFEEIEKNGFDLNLPRYIDAGAGEDAQNIEGHLRGGIPASDIAELSDYWTVCPDLRATLLREVRPGYFELCGEKVALKAAIYGHPQFEAFIARLSAHFEVWASATSIKLKELGAGCKPKTEIVELSEALLAHYGDLPLLDGYDVYQHLMDSWTAAMQDDFYLIAADGWKAETSRVVVTNKKGETSDKGWTCDLVPKSLVVARYFAAEQAAIREQEAQLETLSAQLAELEEEHGGEEGVLKGLDTKSEVVAARHEALLAAWKSENRDGFLAWQRDDKRARDAADALQSLESDIRIEALRGGKGKITAKQVAARLAEHIEADERLLLVRYERELDAQKDARTAANKKLKAAEAALDPRIQAEPENEVFADLRVLDAYLELSQSITELKAQIREAEAALDDLAYAKYPELSEDEIKVLVVDDKWLATLRVQIGGETERISGALTARIRTLAARYETPLPLLATQVESLAARVESHLHSMGFAW